jgi:hypothetical protein
MAGLDIPDEVWSKACGAAGYDSSDELWGEVVELVRAAAPLIVAAELDSLARDMIKQWGQMRADDVRGFGLNEAVRQLRARAAELRGEG